MDLVQGRMLLMNVKINYLCLSYARRVWALKHGLFVTSPLRLIPPLSSKVYRRSDDVLHFITAIDLFEKLSSDDGRNLPTGRDETIPAVAFNILLTAARVKSSFNKKKTRSLLNAFCPRKRRLLSMCHKRSRVVAFCYVLNTDK